MRCYTISIWCTYYFMVCHLLELSQLEFHWKLRTLLAFIGWLVGFYQNVNLEKSSTTNMKVLSDSNQPCICALWIPDINQHTPNFIKLSLFGYQESCLTQAWSQTTFPSSVFYSNFCFCFLLCLIYWNVMGTHTRQKSLLRKECSLISTWGNTKLTQRLVNLFGIPSTTAHRNNTSHGDKVSRSAGKKKEINTSHKIPEL